jgi:hypothetical protein
MQARGRHGPVSQTGDLQVKAEPCCRGYAGICTDFGRLRLARNAGQRSDRRLHRLIDRYCENPNPTKKNRYTVTDIVDLSDHLDQAQRRWREIRDRKELLRKLAAAGRDAIEEEATDRPRTVKETAGALGRVYEPGELKRLSEDWPE